VGSSQRNASACGTCWCKREREEEEEEEGRGYITPRGFTGKPSALESVASSSARTNAALASCSCCTLGSLKWVAEANPRPAMACTTAVFAADHSGSSSARKGEEMIAIDLT